MRFAWEANPTGSLYSLHSTEVARPPNEGRIYSVLLVSTPTPYTPPISYP